MASAKSRRRLDELARMEDKVNHLMREFSDFVYKKKSNLRDSSEFEMAQLLSEAEYNKDQLLAKIHKIKACLDIISNQVDSPDVIKILLLGRTGCGKSKLGNVLVEHESFKIGETLKSETKDGSVDYTMFKGRKFMVVDTIGLNDSTLTEEQVSDVLFDTLLKFSGEINTCLFCIPSDRLDGATINHMKNFIFEFLGEEVIKNSMLVMTKCGRNFFARRDELKRKVIESSVLGFLRGVEVYLAECGYDDKGVSAVPAAYAQYLTSAPSQSTDWTNEINVTRGTLLDAAIGKKRITTRKIRMLIEDGCEALIEDTNEFIKNVEERRRKGEDILHSFKHASFGRKVLMVFSGLFKVVKAALF